MTLLDRLPPDLTPAERERLNATLDLINRNRQIRHQYRHIMAEQGCVGAWQELAERFHLSERQIQRILYEQTTEAA